MYPFLFFPIGKDKTFSILVLRTLTPIGHFQKYCNTLCLSLQNLAQVLLSFSLGIIVSPRGKWKQCLCKIFEGQTNSIMVFLKVVYFSSPVSFPFPSFFAERHRLVLVMKTCKPCYFSFVSLSYEKEEIFGAYHLHHQSGRNFRCKYSVLQLFQTQNEKIRKCISISWKVQKEMKKCIV